MIHAREHWEGVCLSGQYMLEQWLGGDDSAAFFQTTLASDGRRAVVKLVSEAALDGAAALDLFHRIRQLRHSNLVELLDYGRADCGGETVLFSVREFPDDTLASALSRSPLNNGESREVLDSILDALRYLHAQGLAAGALDPDHIVAVGDKIKLSTDALRDAGDSSAYREDIRLLGDLWRQDLMAASPESSKIAAHAADPDPQARWTLAEIIDALNQPLPSDPAPAPLPAVSPPTPAPPISVETISAPPVSFASIPVASSPETAASLPPVIGRDEARDLRPSDRRAEPAMDYRFPKWIFVVAAGLLLLIVALNRPRSTGVAAHSGVFSETASGSPPPETPLPAPVPKPATPQVDTRTASKFESRAALKPSPAGGKEMWRVIAFTYRNRDAAAKKARDLNQRHPGLNAMVFTPKEKTGYYLVSLGGRITHEEAVRLKRSALSQGLPRDVYVQNYAD